MSSVGSVWPPPARPRSTWRTIPGSCSGFFDWIGGMPVFEQMNAKIRAATRRASGSLPVPGVVVDLDVVRGAVEAGAGPGLLVPRHELRRLVDARAVALGENVSARLGLRVAEPVGRAVVRADGTMGHDQVRDDPRAPLAPVRRLLPGQLRQDDPGVRRLCDLLALRAHVTSSVVVRSTGRNSSLHVASALGAVAGSYDCHDSTRRLQGTTVRRAPGVRRRGRGADTAGEGANR